jgi:hypothetical protein
MWASSHLPNMGPGCYTGACTGDCHIEVWETSGQSGEVELEADLARQEGEEGDNKEEGDVEPSIVIPIIKDPSMPRKEGS